MMWGYENGFYENFGMNRFFGFFLPFAIFDLILKAFALWKSARKGQNIWFIALLMVNSMGILPLIYLILNRETSKSHSSIDKRKSK